MSHRFLLGCAAALMGLLLAAGCEAPGAGADVEPSFDASRAFEDLKAQVQIGPRPSGSPGAAEARELIASRLRQAGWRVEEQEFSAGPPGSPPVPMVNVLGSRPGKLSKQILFITHYDTKKIPGIRFVGANDGASGTAVLLELARQLSTRELEFGVTFVFFDGEEAFGPNIHADDGLFGSRWMASKMQREGTLKDIAALILVDMVGDKDLNLAVDLSSSPRLRRILKDSARRLGMAEVVDSRQAMSVIDDHTPFMDLGVRNALALIDFQYGSRRSPGPFWHTEGDQLSAVSEESLNRTGSLLVEAFQEIERDLLRSEGANER